MENKYGIVGVAHVGLPTNDLQKTVEFYKSLGFEVIMQSYNEKAGEKVAFLQIKNYCIETFENGQAAMSDGAYQHVALDVEDIESMYQKICNEKYTIITDGIDLAVVRGIVERKNLLGYRMERHEELHACLLSFLADELPTLGVLTDGSYPPLEKGLHRKILQAASAPPFIAPYFCTASSP